jgi:hypothetical protein
MQLNLDDVSAILKVIKRVIFFENKEVVDCLGKKCMYEVQIGNVLIILGYIKNRHFKNSNSHNTHTTVRIKLQRTACNV